jgi:hypothetical protein
MRGSQVRSARRRCDALFRGGLVQAAVRTILGGCANDTALAFRRPMVRRRADNAFLASHASWRLFYGPYRGVCQAMAAESVSDPLRDDFHLP